MIAEIILVLNNDKISKAREERDRAEDLGLNILPDIPETELGTRPVFFNMEDVIWAYQIPSSSEKYKESYLLKIDGEELTMLKTDELKAELVKKFG